MTTTSPLAARIEVFRHRLVAAAEQMGETLARTAYSPNIKERRDHSCALFDASGRLLAQAAHIPVHLGSMPASVAAVLAEFSPLPGDVFVVNDPFRGGTHLPDITLVTPAILNGCIIGFAANRAHHADVGGSVPGSMGVTTHIDEEGVRIPPTRWFSAGREQPEFLETLLSAARAPDERLGDLRAQLNANRVGADALASVYSQLGREAFDAMSAELLGAAERVMRAAIATLPEGAYFADDALDGDGITPDPVRIRARLDIADGRVTADFAGSSAQVAGCVNCPLAVTQSAVYYVFACLAGDRLPHNAGMFAPITVIAPLRSVVNAQYPAAVAAGNVETSQRIVDVVLRALAAAVPDVVPAGAAGTMSSLSLGGADPRTGRSFAYYETIAGGMGASSRGPGESAVHTHMTNTLNTPIEALESAYPIRVVRYAVRRGSGGLGRHAGGDGVIREVEALSNLTASILADRARRGGAGLAGGRDGQPLRVTRLPTDGGPQALPCKVTISLSAGERLRIETPGGGGWGES